MKFSSTLLVAAGLVSASVLANDNQNLVAKGQYLATAADCAACHNGTDEQQSPFAGGYSIDSPMGKIIASNITPSKQFGIGNYTEQQFADAVRKGVAADGTHLYPAMPYTAYQGLTDADVKALYAYFMQGVEPVDKAPAEQTELSFPFNVRAAMAGWNLLFADAKPFEAPQGMPADIAHGKYLTDVLAHCGTCHTPRNALMAEDNSQYLAGAALGGWEAPNITSDKTTGIGNWSQQQLEQYLKTGSVPNLSQAGGPMAEAVEHSFRFLTDEDIRDIAAYIKQVPAIKTAAANVHSTATPKLTDINQVITGQGEQKTLADSSTVDGAKLYDSACASCHGRNGQGTADHFYPSLTSNTAVTAALPNNLVMTISHGLSRKGNDVDVLMPAFGRDMTDAQIAAVSNYVRLHFGNIDDGLTGKDVANITSGGPAPFIVRYINLLMALGVIIVLLMLFVIFRRKKH